MSNFWFTAIRVTWEILVSVGLMVILWLVTIIMLPPNTFMVYPWEVVRFLFDVDESASLYAAMWESLLYIGIGYVVAIGLAVPVSCLIVVSARAERLMLPMVFLFGTLPIVAVVPLLRLLLGRGIWVTLVVVMIVSFLPCTLATISGLRSTSVPLLDLMRSWGVGPWRTMLTVRLPSAVPSLVSASRFALPIALTGVILAETIATGQGVGQYMLLANSRFEYVQLWGGISAVIFSSLLLYTLLSVAEDKLSDRVSQT